jgi:phosphoserine phosphatase
MNADLKRPYVISATKRDTLRRYAKERRYQIHGSYTYSQGLGII